MAQVDIYLSYHRADDVYQRKVEAIIRDFRLEGMGDISTVAQNGEGEWWQVVNEQIGRSIVILLVTSGWYAHREYDMQLTLYHQRPFIVVNCKPGIHKPENYPTEYYRALDQKDAVNLFADQGEIVGEELAQFEADLRNLLEDETRQPSRKSPLRPPEKSRWLLLNRLVNRWNQLRCLGVSLIALIGLVVVVVLVAAALLLGGKVDWEKLFPFLSVPVTPGISLPEKVQAPGLASYIAYYVGSSPNYNIEVMNLMNGATHRLTLSNKDNSNPVWSCDGTRLAFTSNETGNYEIYAWDMDPEFAAPPRPSPTPTISKRDTSPGRPTANASPMSPNQTARTISKCLF